MTQNKIPTQQEIKKAQEELWRAGDLYWKLTTSQKNLYDFFHGKTEKVIVMNCSRRLGKSYLAIVMALEYCIKTPKTIVKYVLPEKSWARDFMKPLMTDILAGCPKDIAPAFKTALNAYHFKNGSQIQLAGTDNGNYDKLRGGNSHFCVIDEAGFGTDLKHIIRSVLLPTTLHTKGKILVTTTPPTDPNHEAIELINMAGAEGRLIIKTIYDGLEDSKNDPIPLITMEKIEEAAREYPGGVGSDEFRTEFLCQIITDHDRAVVPEFTKAEKDIVVDWAMPPFCTKYVSMDIGFVDLTVVLFGYYDFANCMVVIQDELVINGQELTTERLAQDIMRKEIKNWTNKITGETDKPFMRVSDNNMIVINDLSRLHGLYFRPTDKMGKAEAINEVRQLVDRRELVINPNCTTLINHLKFGSWDKNKKSYLRSKDNGHFDAIDALVYLVRNINKNINPFPKGYKYQGLGSRGNVFIADNQPNELDGFGKHLQGMFQVKSSFRKKPGK